MTRTRKAVAVVIASLGLMVGLAPIAQAGSFQSDHKCSPGQQGNKHPGFKPGSC